MTKQQEEARERFELYKLKDESVSAINDTLAYRMNF